MSERHPWGRRPDPSRITDHSVCPFCVQDGETPKQQACQRHLWANRNWYEKYRQAAMRAQ